jgi:transcription antitermination factor NusG
VPTEVVWVGRDRRERRALFPGYLFVTVSPGQTFGAVEERPSAIRFVRFDGQPAWVSMDLVETLRAAETLGAFDRTLPKGQRTALFRRGQAVRFASGPWQGLVGNVERSARDRVQLLLDLLGRSVVVEAKEADLVPV